MPRHPKKKRQQAAELERGATFVTESLPTALVSIMPSLPAEEQHGRGMAGGGSMEDVRYKAELDEALRGPAPVVLHFWSACCEASKHMDQVFARLAADFPHARFLRVEAAEQPEISEAFAISSVPSFAFFKDGKVVDTLEGENPSGVANKVAKLTGSGDRMESATPPGLGMMAGPVVLETVEEMTNENGSQVESAGTGIVESLKNRLQQLVNSHSVFLFMKGTPDQPKCGFSRKVVDILKDEGVKFGSFDILTDNEVRKGIKKFSNWPTFPQLFCKGELLGGCDIAVAMHESGELKKVISDHKNPVSSEITKAAEPVEVSTASEIPMPGKTGGIAEPTSLSAALTSRLESLINSSPVMLFMRGKPEEPKCGFSRKVVEILRQEKVEFQTFDILSDDEVRQGLKVYSNWSSFPQVYIKGELIGGSDVMLEMQKSGELKKIISEKGILAKETLEDRLKNLISSLPTRLCIKGTTDARRKGFRCPWEGRG